MDCQDLGISVITVVGSAGGPDGPHNSTCLSECSRRTAGLVWSSSLGHSGHSDAGPDASCRSYWVNFKHFTTGGCGGGGFFDGGEDLTVEPPLVDDGVVVDGASGDLGGDDIPGHSSVPSEELGCLLLFGGSPAPPPLLHSAPHSPQSVSFQSLGDAASSPD